MRPRRVVRCSTTGSGHVDAVPREELVELAVVEAGPRRVVPVRGVDDAVHPGPQRRGHAQRARLARRVERRAGQRERRRAPGRRPGSPPPRRVPWGRGRGSPGSWPPPPRRRRARRRLRRGHRRRPRSGVATSTARASQVSSSGLTEARDDVPDFSIWLITLRCSHRGVSTTFPAGHPHETPVSTGGRTPDAATVTGMDTAAVYAQFAGEPGVERRIAHPASTRTGTPTCTRRPTAAARASIRPTSPGWRRWSGPSTPTGQ